MVKTIVKIHHFDLRLKAFGSRVGKSLDHRSQAVSFIRAGLGHRGCSVVWISLERQTGSAALPRGLCRGPQVLAVTSRALQAEILSPVCLQFSSRPQLSSWLGERRHVWSALSLTGATTEAMPPLTSQPQGAQTGTGGAICQKKLYPLNPGRQGCSWSCSKPNILGPNQGDNKEASILLPWSKMPDQDCRRGKCRVPVSDSAVKWINQN